MLCLNAEIIITFFPCFFHFAAKQFLCHNYFKILTSWDLLESSPMTCTSGKVIIAMGVLWDNGPPLEKPLETQWPAKLGPPLKKPPETQWPPGRPPANHWTFHWLVPVHQVPWDLDLALDDPCCYAKQYDLLISCNQPPLKFRIFLENKTIKEPIQARKSSIPVIRA